MNTNRGADENNGTRKFAVACVEQCRKLGALLAEAKESLIAEFKETFEIHERLLHQVINEAEALACETEYPHLVFPALALEKVRVAANWHERQGSIRRRDAFLAFAA
jgi:hypothetical protein